MLVLEKASEEERGGNSTFTAGGFRFVHNGVEDLRKDVLVDLSDAEAKQMFIPPFTAETYMDDLMQVTENLSEPELADLLVNRSRETVVWMREKGVRWIPMFKRQSYLVNGINHFFGGMAVEAVGGGWGLVDFLFKSAERNGIAVRYNTGLRKLIQNRKGEVTGVTVFGPDGYEDITPRPSCWPAAGSRPIRKCACATTAPAGRWRRCAARGTTPATASRRRWRSAPRRSAAGPPATPCNGTSARRRSATAWCWTTTRSTPTRSASSSTPMASASSMRARISATTPMPNTAAR